MRSAIHQATTSQDLGEAPATGRSALAARERARRAALLGLLLDVTAPLAVGIGALGVAMGWPLAAAGTLCLALVTASALVSRADHVKLASALYIGSLMAVPTLLLALGTWLPPLAPHMLYVLFALPVVLASLLLSRRHTLAVAAGALATASVHWVWVAPSQTFGGALGSASSVLAVAGATALACLGARELERALAREAERTAEVERLYAALQGSHAALERKTEEAHRQAERLGALNTELVSMQMTVEASYHKLAEANHLLQEQATTDAVTALANHRAFQEHLRAYAAQALRHQQPLSLLLLDLDFFKLYNDHYGHPAGDDALRAVGAILTQCTRTGDLAARYGGEEFAVVLPHTDQVAAEQAAERIRAAIEAYEFDGARLTASVGVAALHVHARDAEDLVRAADGALYTAKRTGRNNVCVAAHIDTGQGARRKLPHHARIWLRRMRERPTRSPHTSAPMPDPYGGIEGLVQEPAGAVLNALLAALDWRDCEAAGHSVRVARFALRLARELEGAGAPWRPSAPITPGDMRELALGSLLHDIGKIHVPDAILRKPGSLSSDEWEVVRMHPITGAELISHLPLLAPATRVVRSHHERWDGRGYPDGLAGDQIPWAARVFAVCDAVDSMTVSRPGRPARTLALAQEEIVRQAGSQFDPNVVEAFVRVPLAEWEGLRSGADGQLRAAA
ncbi:MAG: diguanylate cyclase [Chthonomonadales bacterium]|nr:diguanylate cyclase [Chthonomonadales bacterium]